MPLFGSGRRPFPGRAECLCSAPAGILFTDLLGLPNWVTAGAEVDLPLPLPTLIGIEAVIFAVLELKRYEGFKKTGKVARRAARPANA